VFRHLRGAIQLAKSATLKVAKALVEVMAVMAKMGKTLLELMAAMAKVRLADFAN